MQNKSFDSILKQGYDHWEARHTWRRHVECTTAQTKLIPQIRARKLFLSKSVAEQPWRPPSWSHDAIQISEIYVWKPPIFSVLVLHWYRQWSTTVRQQYFWQSLPTTVLAYKLLSGSRVAPITTRWIPWNTTMNSVYTLCKQTCAASPASARFACFEKNSTEDTKFSWRLLCTIPLRCPLPSSGWFSFGIDLRRVRQHILFWNGDRKILMRSSNSSFVRFLE